MLKSRCFKCSYPYLKFLFVKPRNSLEIAEAVIKMLENDKLKKELESGARKLYNENSLDKLVKKYEKIFLNINLTKLDS